MDGSAEPNHLLDLAGVLADQIKKHAEIVVHESPSPDVVAAINSLRAAALGYVQAVSDQTGWGNVFDALERDRESEGDRGSARGDPSSRDAVITYRAEYRIRVRDFNAARHLLRWRYEALGKAHCDDSEESYTGIIAGLAEIDGWDPYRYDQQIIEVLLMKWDTDVETNGVTDPPHREAGRKRGKRPR
jgi:hypothetical protein